MEKLFLEARYKGEIKLEADVIEKLPQKIALATTVQFVENIELIKKSLEEKGKIVELIKGHHSKYQGQVLGCDVLNYDINISSECILYIGTGRFHPIALAYRYKIKTFSFNPITNELNEIIDSEVKDYENKLNASKAKFYSSSIIGLIKSLKPGQAENQDKIDDLQAKFGDKSFYEFVSDDIDFIQLNNFSFIDCWVITACPRIAVDDSEKLDKPIVNILEII